MRINPFKRQPHKMVKQTLTKQFDTVLKSEYCEKKNRLRVISVFCFLGLIAIPMLITLQNCITYNSFQNDHFHIHVLFTWQLKPVKIDRTLYLLIMPSTIYI